MKYFVNENCIGCGTCNSICPEVFHMKEDGFAEAIVDDVEDLKALADEAMNTCPVEAIETR